MGEKEFFDKDGNIAHVVNCGNGLKTVIVSTKDGVTVHCVPNNDYNDGNDAYIKQIENHGTNTVIVTSTEGVTVHTIPNKVTIKEYFVAPISVHKTYKRPSFIYNTIEK